MVTNYTNIAKLFGQSNQDSIKDPKSRDQIISCKIHEIGVLYLGISSNDVRSSPVNLQQTRIQKFLEWQRSFERALMQEQYPYMSEFQEHALRYLYFRLAPDNIRKLLLVYPKESALVFFNRKITKKIKTFIDQNYEKVTLAEKCIMFQDAADCNLFMVLHGKESGAQAVYLYQHTHFVDSVIQSFACDKIFDKNKKVPL